MKKIFLLMPVLLFSGCITPLPSGEAPEGKITNNTPVQVTSTQEELENLAATSLCAYIMMQDTVQSVNSSDLPSERVLTSISGITGVQKSKYALYHLEFKNGVFRLVSGKDIVHWQYPEK